MAQPNGGGQPQFPGIPAGFDMSALQNVLSDPGIKDMAEQIANDPSFAQMTQALQSSMAGMATPDGSGGAANGAGPPAFDSSKYMEAMGGVLQNPQFMQMAEQLGQQIMNQDPGMMQMMQGMQDPQYRETIEQRLQELKSDPELASVMQDIETGGPAAMMKYWNDPEVLKKLGGAMGDSFTPDEIAAGMNGGFQGEGEEQDEELTVHSAASTGDAKQLQELLDGGGDKEAKDEEGRTALHLACGYGELECAEVLLKAGADVNSADNNKNTALHYAAGYGQAREVSLLITYKADTAAKNLDGKTALEVATLKSETDVVKLLQDAADKETTPTPASC